MPDVIEEPLRAELLSVEQLKRFAQELARTDVIDYGPGYNRLLPRLADNAQALRAAHQVLVWADGQGRRMAPPAEWLLDNFYLIEQQIQLARIHLPKRYSRQLPRLAAGPRKGFPRVYDMAFELIAHLDGLLDEENTAAFVAAYQTVDPLQLGELWAFPIALRLGLIENLRRVAVLVARRRQEKDDGIRWAERVQSAVEKDPKQILHLLAEFADAHTVLSAPFLEEFVDRLQGQGPSVGLFLNWIDQMLAEEATTVAQKLQRDSHIQAAEHLSISNSIGSLRFLSAMDWKRFVESQSLVERILERDPAGIHAMQDFATRDHYRHVVESLALSSGRAQPEVAELALSMASAVPSSAEDAVRRRHIGFYFVGAGRTRLRRVAGCRWSFKKACVRLVRRCRLTLYLGTIAALSLLGAAVAPWLAGLPAASPAFWLLALAAAVPASSLAISLVNFFVTLIVPPHPLPRLDFSRGIPEGHRTFVVVPTIIDKPEAVESLVAAMEIRYLGNRDPQLDFALLTDFADAEAETLPGEDALLRQAGEAIARLNARHTRPDGTPIFHLLHRPRVWNPRERRWMGYERKRGKLEHFNALLRGESRDAFCFIAGEMPPPGTVRNVITLDTDTDLPRGTAAKMIGALAHPLNRPRFDPRAGRVVEGYTILQPRVTVRLLSANRSLYSRLVCGQTGLDPYSREVSDVYQDLFGEGSFVGKGIYDVDAFRQALHGRFPENVVLSHDLLESAYARSALLGCVEIYEDMPSSYLGDISRQHRWMRGDWQILPWLGVRPPSADGRRVRLSLLSQWKIFDNLRRALVAPSLTALLLAGWIAGPVSAAVWTGFAVAVLGLTTLLRTTTLLLRKPRERGITLHMLTWAQALLRHVAQPIQSLACLPYEAAVSLGAFAASALRMPFTRSGLMIWHLPSYSRRNARHTLAGVVLEMWPSLAVTAAAAALVTSARPASLPSAAPLLALWALAPIGAWAASRPRRRREPGVTETQRRMLRALAWRTWRFFDTFTTETDNWLPPDNFQARPDPVVAPRTSPTNMGFGLLANLTAWDFGYISTASLAARTEQTLDTMEKLERYRGQFYNWYDTRTLKPLNPLYVSSVDSGNLAGALVALRAGLHEVSQTTAFPPQLWRGLQDAVAALSDEAGREAPAEVLTAIRDAQLLLVGPPDNLADARNRLDQLARATARIRQSAGDIADLHALAETLTRQCRDHADWAETLGDADPAQPLRALARSEGDAAAAVVADLVQRLEALSERCHEIHARMDFRFLYNDSRDLLSIGFDVPSRRLDPGCYDLLASESRITSFLIIAGEQAPPEHWFALGRLLTGQGSEATLLSWSGSMFEYLMPPLFMADYPDTLLSQTCHAVIRRQIRYARQRRIPWGISESCYNATDAHHTYQYRAFGVPGLGLKRGLSDDLVVAPYATLMALPFMPEATCENIERLIGQEDALGLYGMVEAIDYTPSRVPRGKSRAVVHAYMSHHQGMSLLALSHFLCGAPIVRRFMSDPAVRATDVLLQERVPEVTPAIQPHGQEAASGAEKSEIDASAAMRVFSEPDLPVPEVHLLSNGDYHVMTTHAGGGYSRWHDLLLTRWREDSTCDAWGAFGYLRDIETNACWSLAHQPVCKRADFQESIFTQGRAEFRRRDGEIETKTEMCVSPEDDVEIRRVTLTNHGQDERRLEFTSYAEVVLAPPAADLAHRVFSSLFVQTEIVEAGQAILCTRRRRGEDEPEAWMFHMLAPVGPHGDLSFETDRQRFLGRGRTPARPAALEQPAGASAPLSNTAGCVLDPVVAIRATFDVTDEAPVQFHIVTGAARTRQQAVALADQYRDRHFVDRAFDMAWSHSQIVLRLINVSEAEAQLYGRLAASVVFANPRNRAPSKIIASNTLGQQSLWRFGISGDLPITLLRIGDIAHMDLVTDVIRAHAYWRLKGLPSDLVILNEDYSGYRAALNDRIVSAINASPDAGLIDKPGGIFLRRNENLSEEDRVLFQSVARIVLTDTAETLREQVERRYTPRKLPPALEPAAAPPAAPPAPLAPSHLIFRNGLGGFTPDGREYVIDLEAGLTTPAPWVNVIASPRVGTVVSESGAMYTWVENAHEFRLTPWANDPVSDPSGETYYLRDDDTGAYWSPLGAPARGTGGTRCRHGFGYTVFEREEAGIVSETWVYVATDAPVKFVVVRLRNPSDETRRLSLFGCNELVLGEWRHANLLHVNTSVDSQSGLLIARNPYNRVFGRRVAFAGCSEKDAVVTGSRVEFIGRNGSLAAPDALGRVHLSGRTGAGLDPVAALQARFELPPGGEREVVFTLGACNDITEARSLAQRLGGRAGARTALDAVWAHWNRLLGSVYLEAPGAPALSVLVNGWLPYQVLSCRIWGRSGFYQSGGAYGFRDQIQDAMALLHNAPEVLREQILRCAARQFREGDVQHWWHPPEGAGVRTKISDDLLWLPQAISRYVLATGDTGVLDVEAPFLEGRSLGEREESQYEPHAHSTESGSLYEHGVRAITRSLVFGAHGLPLIGCGDWNDGMNRVGIGGQGESVWLGWFLCDTLRRFAPVAEARGDAAFAERCRREAEELSVRIEATAWDGDWYRRAYFDDGTPLGSAQNDECRIDSLSQSWAVLSGAAEPSRARRAMQSAREHLVREEAGIVQLFDPPFDKTALDPGYIKGYPPGVRENGGQYTHGAIWTAMAFAMMGDAETAWSLFDLLNPVRHGDSAAAIARYRVEPYVMAADLYGAEPHTGRGGWSWYTGAAGWMYRFAIETLLGLERQPGHLVVAPRLPAEGLDAFTLKYRHRECFYAIEVRRAAPGEVPGVRLDGQALPDSRIPLLDDGRDHHADILMISPDEVRTIWHVSR